MINSVSTGPWTIKRGEEFFVSYGYSPLDELPWYREVYKKFGEEHPELVNEELLKTLTSMGEEEGVGVGPKADEEKDEQNKV